MKVRDTTRAARSLARESVSLRRGAFEGAISGLTPDGSEIVVSAFVPPDLPILTQLRERTLFFVPSPFYLFSPGSTFFTRLARARVRFRFCFASTRSTCVHFRPNYWPRHSAPLTRFSYPHDVSVDYFYRRRYCDILSRFMQRTHAHYFRIIFDARRLPNVKVVAELESQNFIIRNVRKKYCSESRYSVYLAVFRDSLFIEGLHKEPRDGEIRLRNKCLRIKVRKVPRFESLSDGNASYSVFAKLPQAILIAELNHDSCCDSRLHFNFYVNDGI